MSPSPANVCKACGTPIVAAAPLGHCPKCLVGLGLLDESVEPAGGKPESVPQNRQFAGYLLLRQIGKGGMGVVYEARHIQLRRAVALKVILDSELASPVAQRRFQIEAEAAARLDHPHIVPIYEVGEYQGQPFIAMKLVQGESLRARLQRGEYAPPCNREVLHRPLGMSGRLPRSS